MGDLASFKSICRHCLRTCGLSLLLNWAFIRDIQVWAKLMLLQFWPWDQEHLYDLRAYKKCRISGPDSEFPFQQDPQWFTSSETLKSAGLNHSGILLCEPSKPSEVFRPSCRRWVLGSGSLSTLWFLKPHHGRCSVLFTGRVKGRGSGLACRGVPGTVLTCTRCSGNNCCIVVEWIVSKTNEAGPWVKG